MDDNRITLTWFNTWADLYGWLRLTELDEGQTNYEGKVWEFDYVTPAGQVIRAIVKDDILIGLRTMYAIER